MSNDIDPKLLEEAQQLETAIEEEISEDQEIEQEVNEVEEEIEEEAPVEVQKAKKNGHLSEDDYKKKYGTLKGYKSPEEFNKFGEIYPEIKEALKGINNKLAQREKELEASLKYMERVKEREQQAARREVAQALQEAKNMSDVDAVRHWTQQEAKLDYQEAQEASQKAVSDIQNVVSGFEQRNADWYNKDQEMTARAVQIDQEIRQGKYQHIMPMPQNYEQLSHQIEVLVKQEFSDRVGARSQTRTAPALGSTNSSIAKGAKAEAEESRVFKTLDSDLKAVYAATKRMMEKSGYSYTEVEFIKKLRQDGEI